MNNSTPEKTIMNRVKVGDEIKHISQQTLLDNLDAFASKRASDRVYVTSPEGKRGTVEMWELRDVLDAGFQLIDDTEGYNNRPDIVEKRRTEQKQKAQEDPANPADVMASASGMNDTMFGRTIGSGQNKGGMQQVISGQVRPTAEQAIEPAQQATQIEIPRIPGQTDLEYAESMMAAQERENKRYQEQLQEEARARALPESVEEIDSKILEIDRELEELTGENDAINEAPNTHLLSNTEKAAFSLFKKGTKDLSPEQRQRINELREQKVALGVQYDLLRKFKKYEEYDKGKDRAALGRFFSGMAVGGDLQALATFGISQINNDLEFLGILEKAQNGEKLTSDEHKAIQLYQNLQQIQSKDRGAFFSAGSGMQTTFEFMRDMALFGFGGMAKSAANQGVKQVLKGTLKNFAKKSGEIFLKAPLTPSFYNNLTANQVRNFEINTDADGKWDVSRKESALKNAYRTYAETTTEFLSEGLGNVFEQIGLVSRLARSAGKGKGLLSKAVKSYDRIHNKALHNKWGKFLLGGMQQMGLNNMPTEFLEEIAVIPMQSLLLWENQFDQLADPRFYQEVAISTAALGGMHSVVNLAAGGPSALIERRKVNKKIDQARNELEGLRDSTDDVEVKSAIDNLYSNIENRNYYNEDYEFTGEAVINDLAKIREVSSANPDIIKKAENFVQLALYKEGQTEAMRAIAENEIGRFEYGTSGGVMLGQTQDGDTVFILDETGKSVTVKQQYKDAEPMVMPRDAIVNVQPLTMDAFVTDWFVTRQPGEIKLETVEDVQQMDQQAEQAVQQMPLSVGSTALYEGLPVKILDMYDGNVTIEDENGQTHTVAPQDLQAAPAVGESTVYILPDGRRGITAGKDNSGNYNLQILDDNGNFVDAVYVSAEDLMQYDKISAEEANTIEQIAQDPQAAVEAAAEQESVAQEDQLPVDKDGNIDFDTLLVQSPERFLQEFSAVVGEDRAIAQLQRTAANIDEQIQQVTGKLEKTTSLNETVKLQNDINSLTRQKESIQAILGQGQETSQGTEEILTGPEETITAEQEILTGPEEIGTDSGEIGTENEEISALSDEMGTPVEEFNTVEVENQTPDLTESVKTEPVKPKTILESALDNNANAALEQQGQQVNTEPTEGQKEAGNYKMGHIKINGYDITIENPKGSTRSGIDNNGIPWEVQMNNHYGYFRRTEGKDGDQIDVFIGDSPTSGKIFIVDQVDEKGNFDEHKVMMGFDSIEEAEQAYMSNYSPGWRGLGNITEVSQQEFKDWVKDGQKKTQPFAERQENDIKPIGVGVFGNIYNQFKGKAKDAIDFLSKIKSGEALAALSHPEIGDISIVWGSKRAGLEKIINKHPEVLNDLQTIIQDMKIVQKSDNRIKLESEDYFAVVSKDYNGTPREQWLLTAYEKKKTDASGGSMDIGPEPVGMQNGTAPLQGIRSSEDKVKQSSAQMQTPVQQESSVATKPAKESNRLISDDEYADLRKKMREKLSQLNVGIDPEMLSIGIKMAVYHIENGAYKFTDYTRRMVADLGDAIRPYLKAFYNGVRDLPEAAELAKDMDSYADVVATDVNAIAMEDTVEVTAELQPVEEAGPAEQEPATSVRGTVTKDVNTKTGEDIWVVKLNDRVERDEYNQIAGEAKAHGGYYSRFKKGFIFKSESDANKFNNIDNGQITDTQAEQRTADTIAVVSQAEDIISKIGSQAEAVRTPAEAVAAINKCDVALEKINDQLALLGYYKADYDDSKFNESYGYAKTAEKKALKDAEKLAKALAKDLGIDVGRKKLASANIAPAGGDIIFRLPLKEDRQLYVNIGISPNSYGPYDSNAGSDDLFVRKFDVSGRDAIYYRIENLGSSGANRYGFNNFANADVMYNDLLSGIRNIASDWLPSAQAAQPQQENKPVMELVKPKEESPNPDFKVGSKVLYNGEPATITGIEMGRPVLDTGMGPVMYEIANWNELSKYEPQTKDNGKEKLRKLEAGTAAARGKGQPRVKDEALGGGQQPQVLTNEQAGVDRDSGTTAGNDTAGSRGVSERNASEYIGKEFVYKDGFGVERSLTIGNYFSLTDTIHATDSIDGPVDYKFKTFVNLIKTRQLKEKRNLETKEKNSRNWRYPSTGTGIPTSPAARLKANMAAIETLRQLQESGAEATPEQMEILSRYSGWGGMRTYFNSNQARIPGSDAAKLKQLLTDEEYNDAVMSLNSAYYTPAEVINTLWDVAAQLGFKGGNILEGSAGTGNILGLMPEGISSNSNIEAVEIDSVSGSILSYLYPDAKTHVQGFEKTDIPNGSVDLAITNVPFVTGLNVKDPIDKDLSRKFKDIHNFCIAKNVRKLREGGIGIFITSNGTLDKSKQLREWLVSREGNADVIGAFRLNNRTFEGAPVTSDIIVVRKRVGGAPSSAAIDVLGTTTTKVVPVKVDEKFNKKTGQYEDVTREVALDYNTYFQQHPENMGGEMAVAGEKGDTFRPASIGLYPVKGIDQGERMRQWVATFSPVEAATPSTQQAAPVYEQSGEKEGALVVDKDGRLCISRRGEAVPLDVNDNKIKGKYTKAEAVKDYNGLKKALADVLEYQTSNSSDEGLAPLLKKLNSTYDGFVKKYGPLNRNVTISFLRNDVDFASIAAVENYSESETIDGKKKVETSKTDVFKGRVVGYEPSPTPTSVSDGIILSVQKNGHIDPDMIAGWLDMGKEQVIEQVVSSRMGFINPVNGLLEVRHEYLSGNVREKLSLAKANNEDGRYSTNIEELEKVVPMDIPAHLIEFSLGSTWIDPKMYSDFVQEKYDADVKYYNINGVWAADREVYANNEKNRSAGVYSESVGKRVMGHELFAAAMNNTPITVSKTVKHYNGTTETITDKQASQMCTVRMQEIKEEFKDWARARMQADPELAAQMTRIYNDKFNAIVPKTIDDVFTPERFEGANKVINLYPHQKKSVIRATTEPLMLAHEVGTGKTFTLITTAMEMRRLGTAKKPMIVVQNATVGQFVSQAKFLYPNAKVLTVGEKDRTAEGRKEFYAKIKYNDWDIIVVPQSVFEMIPDNEERMRDFVQEKIDEKMYAIEAAREAGMDSRFINQMESELKQLEDDFATGTMNRSGSKKNEKKEAIAAQNAAVRAEEQLDRTTDDVEDFDAMGIDALLVDEAHEYKHLGFSTSMKRGVKGVDPSYSKKAASVYLKTRAVLEKSSGKNVVFATGTPISNTAAEIWTFMRYLMPKDTMVANDIYYFDDFVRNFGNITQNLEFATNGKFKENTRFASYVNLPELVRLWGSVSDTVLTKDVGYVNDKVPDMESGKAMDIFLPQSPGLVDIMRGVRTVLENYDKMSGKEKKANSHIPLTMYGIAKRAAIDPRLVDSNAIDEPLSKTNRAVEETLRTLKETQDYKGTVAIFCDSYRRLEEDVTGKKKETFNLFQEIKRKLVAAGVPAGQIVIMESGMTVSKKEKVFADVNAGNVRVILGSTQTLGTGVNIQQRLHTLIHMDAPDRPMDYTQRNGRILRQGNLHKEWGKDVRVLRFGVEDSLDVTSYQRLKTKSSFIDSVMDSKPLLANNQENRTLEEEEEGLFDNPVAVLSGSQYALLKSQAERELRKWQSKYKQWEADQVYVNAQLKRNEGQLERNAANLQQWQQSLAQIKEKFPDGKVGTVSIDGVQCSTEEERIQAYKDINKKMNDVMEKLRNNPYGNREHYDYTLAFDGMPVEVSLDLKRESRYNEKIKGVQVSVRRDMKYSIPELKLADVPVSGAYIKGAVDDILENVVTGKDIQERLEAVERGTKRLKEENKLLSVRDGKPFEFTSELEDARKKVDEYTELMKKELAEKEAKYAEQGTGATVDVENVLQDDDSSVQAQIDQVETAAELSFSEQMAYDAVMQALSNASIPVVMATDEMVEEVLPAKNAEPFYSNAFYAISKIRQEKATTEQWLAMLAKNGGLKAAEDKWTGLSDWLKFQKGLTSKQSILEYLALNEIKIEEVSYIDEYDKDYDADPDAVVIDPTRLEYTTSGLTNKKEIALTVPNIEPWNEDDEVHFGEAGGGRAIAWIRFGDTVIPTIADELSVANSYAPKNAVEEAIKDYIVYCLKGGDDLRTCIGYAYNQITDAPQEATGWTTSAVDAVSEGMLKAADDAKKMGERVLVIDEIQSKRHQEARKKGYKSDYKNSKAAVQIQNEIDEKTARLRELAKDKQDNSENELVRLAQIDIAMYEVKRNSEYDELLAEENEIKTRRENRESELFTLRRQISDLKYQLDRQINFDYMNSRNAVPDAPFEKNWHELAMKRMLRYAAENGYDKVSWLTGIDQAERYDIGQVVTAVERGREFDDGIRFDMYNADDVGRAVFVKDGIITKSYFDDIAGKPLVEVVGKELSEKMLQMPEGEVKNIKSMIGGEGMKGFYDRILVDFMNKYGKKWGVKVKDIELPTIGKTVHSVEVTPEMVRSVMEGQPMFNISEDGISDETIQQYQERLSEIDNHIRSWKEQGRSIPEAFWRERGKVIKQFLDEIGTMPAVMVTRSNFEQIMSSNGCDADLIDDVRAHLEYEEIPGLHLQGNVYVFANDVMDIDDALITYLHERQHYVTHQDFRNNVNQILGRAESLEELQNAVVSMSGNPEYRDLDKANLADEFISFAMALSYTNVNFADELRNIGVNEQLISYIDEYSKSQWNQAGWANSRKKRTEAAYDGQGKTGSSGENGRDSRTGSQEMGQQGLRTVSGSPQTTGERKFFKSRVGTVRGWTKGGVIYLTKDGLNPDTPIHEYTHIWADAVQKFNPALWNNVKSLMKRLPQWQQVVSDPNYQDIAGNEDAVASEVLARYSGKRGARRLEQDAKAMGESTGRRGSAARLLERVKEAIAQFWDWVNVNLFNLSGFSSAEEVADRVLYDLVSGTDLNRPADITTQILDKSGTAELLGAEAHAAMMDEVFGGMEVIQQARAARGDRAANTREYISQVCENVATRGDEAMKIAAAVRAAFTDKGMRLDMSDAALLHQMWKECNSYPDTTVKERLEQNNRSNKVRFSIEEDMGPVTNDIKLGFWEARKEKWVDRMHSVAVLKKIITTRHGKITSETDPYMSENLASSRSMYEIDKFKKDMYEPLLNKVVEIQQLFLKKGLVKQAKLAYKAVNDYLYALHAPERNKHICVEEVVDKMMKKLSKEELKHFKSSDHIGVLTALVSRLYNERLDSSTPFTSDIFANNIIKAASKDKNENDLRNEFRKKFTDLVKTSRSDMDKIFKSKRGNNRSGMSDKEAAEIVKKYRTADTQAALDELSAMVQRCNDFTLDTWLKYSMIDKETYDNYRNMYQHYIPLRNWADKEDVDYDSLGKHAFNHASEIVNLNRKAQGRSSRADDPLAYIASLAQSAVVVGNKNMVHLNAFRLVQQNKDILEDIAILPQIYYVQVEDSEDVIAYDVKPPQELFDKGLVTTKTNRSYRWHKTHAEYEAHTVPVIIDGTRYMVVFKGDIGIRIASALNNTNVNHWAAADALRPLTRWLSAVRTSYSPEFVLVNFVRDFLFGNIAYGIEGGNALKLNRNLASAFKAINRAALGKEPSSALDRMYEEFQREGGQTGFIHMRKIEQIKKENEIMRRKLSGEKTVGDWVLRNWMMRFGKSSMEYLSVMSENAMRFAVYMTERQKGVSAKDAAYKAHEITVNFNRKGTLSGNMGAFYSFFNASVQGTYRLWQLGKNYPKRTAMAITSLALTKVLAAVISAMIGGDDYDELSDYVKFSNMIIPIGEDDNGRTVFFTLPMPQGMRAFTNLADVTVDVIRGTKTVGEGISTWMLNAVGEFAPLAVDAIDLTGRQSGQSIVAPFVPTAVQPFFDVWSNKDFKGDPIYKEDFTKGTEDYTPEYKKVYSNANPALVETSRLLNRLGGGSDELSSAIKIDSETGAVSRRWYGYALDWNPARAEHIIDGYLGGMATFFSNILKTGKAAVSEDVDLEYYSLPIAGRFTRQAFYKDGYDTWYEVSDMVKDIEATEKAMEREKDWDSYALVKGYGFNAELSTTFHIYDDRVKQLQDVIKSGNLSPQERREYSQMLDNLISEAAGMFEEIMNKYEEN